ARQGDRPGVVLHVLRVDEHLKRTPPTVLYDVVQGDVERVLAVGPADLVGLAGQRLRAAQGLRHVDHTTGLEDVGGSWRRGWWGYRKGQFGLARRELDARRLISGRKHRSRHFVRPVGCAALAAERISLPIDVLEAVEGDLGGQVDRFRNRA